MAPVTSIEVEKCLADDVGAFEGKRLVVVWLGLVLELFSEIKSGLFNVDLQIFSICICICTNSHLWVDLISSVS